MAKAISGGNMARLAGDKTATIAITAQASDSVATGPAAWGSYLIPSAFTGANVTIQVSNDGTNWSTSPALPHESVPEVVVVDGNYTIPGLAFAFKFFRFYSASAEAAARTITVYMKG